MNIMQELNKKRKGFVMLPVILATFIVGLLGVGLTSIYSGAFATMSASKVANDAQNVAAVEKEILQALGYDGYKPELTDFKSMEEVLGDKNTDWEYSVQKVSEKTNSDGSNIAVVKINVRKKGDSVIRYSEEVPLSSKNTNRFAYNDTTDKTKRVALKYEQSADEDTPSLHGYVNGVEVPFASQSSIDYLDILDYGKDAFFGWECYNDDGGHPLPSSLRSQSFTFESPLQGKVTIKYKFTYNSSKAPVSVRNTRNFGGMYVAVNGASTYARFDLGNTTRDGQDHSYESSFTANLKKGTNTINISLGSGVERYYHRVFTSYHFSITTLVIKVKGQYIPLNI